MAKKGSHAGSFAGGFMEGLLGVMKMEYMRQHYEALQKHYEALDRHYDRMADIEERKANNDLNAQAARTGAAAGAGFDSAPVKGEDAGMRDHIVQWANDHGKDPSQALAIWRQESQGGQGLAGDKGPDGAPSSFGDFQFHFGGINPNMPNKGMGDDFLRDTGIDMRKPENYNNPDIRYKAADYALNYAAKNDWSPWKKSVEVTRIPNQWANAGQGGATPSLVDASKSINTTGGADATQVHPAFANRVAALSKEAEAATGQPLSFNQVHRTYQQQAEIRARHEAMPGGVHDHPAALPGHSNHEDGTAGDMDNNRAAAYVLTPGPDGKTPLEKHGLQQISDPSTRANDHLHIELPAADKGKTAQAGQRFKPYKVASLGWEPPPESLPSQPPQQGPPQRPPGPSDPSITARGGAGLQDTLLAPPYFFPDMLTRKPYDDTGTVRNPDERNMDPATTAQQAEQAAHYAFVHSGERSPPPPQPQHPASAIPPAPYESGFPPQEDRPQAQPVVSADRGPPYPPPNVQPRPVPPVTTTEGRPDTPPIASLQHPISKPYPAPYESGFPEPPPYRPEDSPNAGPVINEPSIAARMPPRFSRTAEINVPLAAGNTDERLQPAAANAPAANATPAVAVQPGTGAGAIPTRPGWGVIDRPNMDAISGPYHTGRGPSGGPASMGVFDFSTLWKPNPPLPARGAAPAVTARPPPPAPRPAIAPTPQTGPTILPAQEGPTPYPGGNRYNPSGNLVVSQPGQEERSVPVPLPPPRPTAVVVRPPPPVPSSAVTDAPDKPIVPPAAQPMVSSRDEDAEEGIMAQDEAATQMAMMSPDGVLGARKGGAIRRINRYARGGEITRGVTGYAAGATVTPQQVQQSLDAALYGPNAPYSRNDIMYGRPDMTVGDMMTANINALTPEQQTWYNAQNAALGGYQGAMQAQSASYTAPTGERGGQAPTVNQGQLALAGNQLSYYQGLFDPNMPAAKAAAAAAPAATTPAVVTPTVDPTLSQLNSAIPNQPSLTTDTSSTGGTVTGITGVPDTVAPAAVDPTTSATTDTTAPTTTVKPLKTPSTTAPSSPGSGEDIGATDPTKKNPVSATDVSGTSGAYAGFRGGGAIPPRPPRRGYASGGGVMGYASGGAPTAAMLASPGWQNTASTYTTGPDTAPLTNQQLYDLQNTINASPPGMFMGSYSDWLTGAQNAHNPAGASRDLTNYYGAWSAPAPAPVTPAPTPVAPTVTPVTTTDSSTPLLDNNTSAGGGTVTGITGLPDVVTPTNTTTGTAPATTSDTTTTPAVDPTTSSTTTTDAGDTTTKPLNTPSTLAKSTPGVTDTGAIDTTKKNADVSNTSGAYAGFRRGGAIPSRPMAKGYAQGGGVMGYASGGATLGTPATMAQLTSSAYAGPTVSGGWIGTPYAQLAPNQQAWADQQTAEIGKIKGTSDPSSLQFTMMPDAVWPTAAPAIPAAPTPVAPTVTPVTTTDTTTNLDNNTSSGGGTVTGITGLPDVVTPAVDPTTSATTTTDAGDTTTKPLNTPSTLDKSAGGVTDTGATDTTKKSTNTSDQTSAYAGFRKGGVIGHSGAMRYDDGGDVSPSPMGMPPGLAGGQGQPIPPVYYNPATYAGAGAPVGKGITNTSAPTFVAGAIPSLPMFRGGTVKRYAAGGDVTEDMPDASGDVGDDDYAGIGSSTTGTPSGADYRADADVISGGRGGVEPSPQPVGGAAPQQQQQGPPPGAPAWTPQVNDGQGNPSRGLIGAISGGLHFIAHFVGLDGSGQQGAIASDPGTQAARQRLASGQSVDGSALPTREEYTTQIPQAIGADGLHEGLKTLASMEAIHNFWLQHGDMAKADGYAAGMIQTSIQLARDYGAEAVKRYYNGDLKGAVDAMNQSKDVIADGTIVKATVNPDGKTVNVAGKNLNGEELWRQVVGPQAILGAALKTADGSLPWHMYEIAAAKYDPQTKAIIDARTQSRQTDQANEQIAGFGPTSVARTRDWGVTPGVTPTMAAPRPAQQPTVRPPPQSAGGPGVPGLTPPKPSPIMDVAGADASRGGAATGAGGDRAPPATPPAGADTANAPTLLPPGPPTREAADAGANQPAPQAEEVSFETEQATKAQIRQNAHANNWTPEGNPWINGQEIPKPQPIDQASFNKLTPQVQKVWTEHNTAYIEASKYAQAQEDKEYTAKAGDYDIYLKDQRATAAATAAETKAEKGRVAQLARDKELEGFKTANIVTADEYRDLMSREHPLTDDENNKKLGVDGSGNPAVYTHLAAAFLPEANRTTIANDRDAISALANAKLGANNMDPATLRTIGVAFKTASMYSTQTPVEEVARGVMLLASGHKTPDKNPAVLNKRLGTYDITVLDDNGSAVHLTMPVSETLNLYALGDRVRQEAEDARVAGVTKEGESQSWPTPPAPAIPSGPSSVLKGVTDVFPKFAPGQSPGEVIYRNLPSFPGGNPFTRETPPLKPMHPPLPDQR